ncbi:MAG: hypothetical protein C0598_10315 [Marinilabiliales bacterium]|nr:MAG: hypothetical protein C0598_10315 [Marinilabiliales bacterium]
MRSLLLILLLCYTILALASKPLEKIDSLKLTLQKSEPTDKIEILIEIAEAYRFVNMKECYSYGLSAIKHAQEYNSLQLQAKALKSYAISNYFDANMNKAIEYTYRALYIFKELDDMEGLAACYNNIGLFYEEKGELDSSLTNYMKSLKYEEIRGDNTGMAFSYFTLGNTYYYKDQLMLSLDYYFKSLEIIKNSDNNEMKAVLYNAIGVIYEDSKEYDQALQYYNNAEDIFLQLGDDENLARVYMNKGELFSLENKNYKISLKYFNKALDLKNKTGDKTGIALAYNNLGHLYCFMEDYNTALNYLKKSLTLYLELDSKYGIAMVEYNLGKLYNEIGKPKMALNHLNSSLKLADEYGLYDYKMPVYEELLEIYAVKLPNNKNFTNYFKLYLSYKDSIIDNLRYSKIKEIETKFDVSKLVQDADKLKRENEEKDKHIYQLKMLFMLISGVLIFIFLIYIFFFKNKS